MTRMTGIVGAALVVLATAGLIWRPWDAIADPPPKEPPVRDQFAQDRAPKAVPLDKLPAIDGDRAMKYLKQLCDIGPRISATDGMAKQQKLLIDHFEKCGASVTKQEFKAKPRSLRNEIPMTNLIASWNPDRKLRVILCSHYDTRPAAHEEPNRLSWRKPFLSANDGTSGVAILMEIAHHLKELPTGVGVDVVLFDGEEYILEPGTDQFFLGSEHFATEYVRNKAKLRYVYDAAILLDLCGHDGARLAVEGYSLRLAPKLVDQVWKTAAAVGAKSFKNERGFLRADDVLDDHMALNQAGIPAIDIIDFDYKHWHLLSDTPDKCSATQMGEVGKVLAAWLMGLK